MAMVYLSLIHIYHGGDILIFQLLYLDFQLIFAQSLAEELSQCIGFLFQLVCGNLFLEIVRYVGIDSLEMNVFFLFLTLDMGDKSGIDVVFQDNGVHALLPEHVDVLALLDLIGHMVDRGLRFLLVLFLLSGIGRCV